MPANDPQTLSDDSLPIYDHESFRPPVKPRGRFHALSLDLWLTAICHGREGLDRTRAHRCRALDKILRTRDGHSFAVTEIETARAWVGNCAPLER